ncbi:HetP family heterocyst commitment protein [Trichocoleus sp. FACHB-90]|uniref:HetP family heterocyst commitment protein n=1 Tax=Cyanophyceae TaxID=3028117 RepID=UPI001686CE17|nr:HetP family heterocyst commitment protein [Trichocoleus sp. FACHB-90]MBD1929152.1 HetP family heterocyst commitment protein [Trichocoleus sp. FACHB-90]
MTYRIPCSNPNLDKTINPEQFNQVVEAIMAGKYSWACVLLLRFSGYNPLHYIPYRTYNRLLKENCQIGRPSQRGADSINTVNQSAPIRSEDLSPHNCLSKITDLGYLEAVSEPHPHLTGGNLEQGLVFSHPEDSPVEVVPVKKHWFSIF